MTDGLRWEKRQHPDRGSKTEERWSWIVHGKESSIEFWIVLYPEGYEDSHGITTGTHDGRPFSAGGFEKHSRKPGYEGQEKSRGNCQLLGGDCWHDGSSLAAIEFAAIWGGSDEQVFMKCVGWLGE